MSPESLKNKIISIILSVFLFGSQCVLAHANETNFWKERNQTLTFARLTPQMNLPSQTPLRPLSLPASFLKAQKTKFKKVTSTRTDPKLVRLLQILSGRQGSVREVRPAADSLEKNIVIHIQDIHMNGEAQKNIASIIKYLMDQNEIDLVALEGAMGDINLKPFQTFPYQDTIKVGADYLLRENKISGPAYTGLTAGQISIPFVGVDSAVHYQANIGAYKKSANLMPQIQDQLEADKVLLDLEKKAVLNPTLYEFDQLMESFRSESNQLGKTASYLAGTGFKTPLSLDLFLEAMSSESRLDLGKVKSEREQLIGVLLRKMDQGQAAELVNVGAAYRLGDVSHADFYSYLKSICEVHHLSLPSFENLNSYVQYILLSDQIDSDRLLVDLREMENRVYASLIHTPAENDLIQKSRGLYLMGKLIHFGLTPVEWEEYGDRKGQNINLASFEQFYEEAAMRDNEMAMNLKKAMSRNKAKVAVLVTGGFHAHGIAVKNAMNNITTLSYVPTLTKIDSSEGANYLTAFAQEKSPLEKLFEGKQLFLALPPVQQAMVLMPVIAAGRHPDKAFWAFNWFKPGIAKMVQVKTVSQNLIQIVITSLKNTFKYEMRQNEKEVESLEDIGPGPGIRQLHPAKAALVVFVFGSILLRSGDFFNFIAIQLPLVLLPLATLFKPLFERNRRKPKGGNRNRFQKEEEKFTSHSSKAIWTMEDEVHQLLINNKFVEAERQLSSLLMLKDLSNGKKIDLLGQLVLVHKLMGNFQKAKQVGRKGMKLIGSITRWNELKGAALQDFNEQQAFFRVMYSAALKLGGDLEEAISLLSSDNGITLDPLFENNPDAHFTMASILFRAGRLKDSLAVLLTEKGELKPFFRKSPRWGMFYPSIKKILEAKEGEGDLVDLDKYLDFETYNEKFSSFDTTGLWHHLFGISLEVSVARAGWVYEGLSLLIIFLSASFFGDPNIAFILAIQPYALSHAVSRVVQTPEGAFETRGILARDTTRAPPDEFMDSYIRYLFSGFALFWPVFLTLTFGLNFHPMVFILMLIVSLAWLFGGHYALNIFRLQKNKFSNSLPFLIFATGSSSGPRDILGFWKEFTRPSSEGNGVPGSSPLDWNPPVESMDEVITNREVIDPDSPALLEDAVEQTSMVDPIEWEALLIDKSGQAGERANQLLRDLAVGEINSTARVHRYEVIEGDYKTEIFIYIFPEDEDNKFLKEKKIPFLLSAAVYFIPKQLLIGGVTFKPGEEGYDVEVSFRASHKRNDTNTAFSQLENNVRRLKLNSRLLEPMPIFKSSRYNKPERFAAHVFFEQELMLNPGAKGRALKKTIEKIHRLGIGTNTPKARSLRTYLEKYFFGVSWARINVWHLEMLAGQGFDVGKKLDFYLAKRNGSVPFALMDYIQDLNHDLGFRNGLHHRIQDIQRLAEILFDLGFLNFSDVFLPGYKNKIGTFFYYWRLVQDLEFDLVDAVRSGRSNREILNELVRLRPSIGHRRNSFEPILFNLRKLAEVANSTHHLSEEKLAEIADAKEMVKFVLEQEKLGRYYFKYLMEEYTQILTMINANDWTFNSQLTRGEYAVLKKAIAQLGLIIDPNSDYRLVEENRSLIPRLRVETHRKVLNLRFPEGSVPPPKSSVIWKDMLGLNNRSLFNLLIRAGLDHLRILIFARRARKITDQDYQQIIIFREKGLFDSLYAEELRLLSALYPEVPEKAISLEAYSVQYEKDLVHHFHFLEKTLRKLRRLSEVPEPPMIGDEKTNLWKPLFLLVGAGLLSGISEQSGLALAFVPIFFTRKSLLDGWIKFNPRGLVTFSLLAKIFAAASAFILLDWKTSFMMGLSALLFSHSKLFQIEEDPDGRVDLVRWANHISEQSKLMDPSVNLEIVKLLKYLGVFEGPVVSILRGKDPMLFQEVEGVALDYRPGEELVSIAEALNQLGVKGINPSGISKNYAGSITVNFEDTEKIVYEINRLVQFGALSQKPKVHVFKHAERWFKAYLSYELNKKEKQSLSEEELTDIVDKVYAESLGRYLSAVSAPEDVFIVYDEPNFKPSQDTAKILEKNGYQDLLPRLMGAEAYAVLSQSFDQIHDLRLINQSILNIGGRVHVYAKSGKLFDQASGAFSHSNQIADGKIKKELEVLLGQNLPEPRTLEIGKLYSEVEGENLENVDKPHLAKLLSLLKYMNEDGLTLPEAFEKVEPGSIHINSVVLMDGDYKGNLKRDLALMQKFSEPRGAVFLVGETEEIRNAMRKIIDSNPINFKNLVLVDQLSPKIFVGNTVSAGALHQRLKKYATYQGKVNLFTSSPRLKWERDLTLDDSSPLKEISQAKLLNELLDLLIIIGTPGLSADDLIKASQLAAHSA